MVWMVDKYFLFTRGTKILGKPVKLVDLLTDWLTDWRTDGRTDSGWLFDFIRLPIDGFVTLKRSGGTLTRAMNFEHTIWSVADTTKFNFPLFIRSAECNIMRFLALFIVVMCSFHLGMYGCIKTDDCERYFDLFSSKPSHFYHFYTVCDKGLQRELIWVGDDCCTDLNGLLGATWVRTEEERGALLDDSFLSSYGLMARGR